MTEYAVHGYLAEAQRLLTLWGAWQRALNAGYRIGYPTSVAFLHAGEARGNDVKLDDPSAEVIDRLVCRIKHLSPKIYSALLYWYVYEMSVRDCAERCRCSERIFKNRRIFGEHFIAGALAVGAVEKSA